MKFVKSDIIKVRIIEALSSDSKEHTYYSLTKKIGVSFSSLKPNCEFLEALGFIKIKRKESVAGSYNFIKITERGRKVLVKLKQ